MSFLRSARSLVAHTHVPRPTPRLLAPRAVPSARSFATSFPRFEQQVAQAGLIPEAEQQPKKTPIGRIERRLQITFTCTAVVAPEPVEGVQQAEQPCHHRSTHEFSRRSYEKGIVLIECPGCKNRHLIGELRLLAPNPSEADPLLLIYLYNRPTADNLQWFSSTPSPAHPDGLPIGSEAAKGPRTVEQLVKEKGEEVVWLDGGEQGGTWMVEG